jgi:O-Antigen ligase
MKTKAKAKASRAFGFSWPAGILEAGLLLVLPLIFCRGFAEQFSTTKVVFAEALVTLGLAAWTAGLLWGKFRRPAGFRMALPLGALAAAALISCFNSSVPSFSLIEAEYFLCGPLWLVMLVTWRKGEADARRLAKFVAVAGGVAAAIALLQWAGHDPLLFGGYSVQWGTMVPRMRLYSTFGNPNLLCGYLIGAIFLALALALAARKPAAKFAGGVAAALMLAAILGTGSYGGWAALAAGTLVAGLVYMRARKGGDLLVAESKQQRNGPILVALAPAWLIAIGLIQSINPTLTSRLQGRLFLWRAAWPMFLEHPLLGSGWGTFQLRFLDFQARYLAAHPEGARFWTLAPEAHNDAYQILLEAGLLGIAALVWLMVEYAREVRSAARAAESRETSLLLSAAAGGVTAILVNSLVNFQLAVAPTLILLFSLLAFPRLLVQQASPAAPANRLEPAPSPGAHRRAMRAAGTAGIVLFCGFLLWGIARRAAGELDYQSALDLEKHGDYAAAEQADRAGIAVAPSNGKLHFALARALYLQQKYPEALSEAQLAEPTYADSHLVVLEARILDQMGRAAPALESYRRALWLDPTLKTVQADIERLEKSNPR